MVQTETGVLTQSQSLLQVELLLGKLQRHAIKLSVNPPWIRFTLWAAACYNIAWGSFVVVFPNVLFRWAGMQPPNYPELWQCIGMIVGVYGVAYAFAAQDARRHWPIVLVGLLGKVFGPIGFLNAALHGNLPWVAGWVNVTNDLIWWIPFSLILWHVYRERAK
jgi:hypothetical protein